MRRKERGITLIALIVTIIVLLILAGVSIATLTGENGILIQARTIKEETRCASVENALKIWKLSQKLYNSKGETTNQALTELLSDLQKQELLTGEETIAIQETGKITIGGKTIVFEDIEWVETAEGITNGRVTVHIGDYINYDHTDGATITSVTSYSSENGYEDQVFKLNSYTDKWRVLGVENGELLLISSDVIVPDSGGFVETRNKSNFYLKGRAGYENAITELNKISNLYGQGKHATGARSVTVEDINKITGYNPNNTGVRDPEQSGRCNVYERGSLGEFGISVTVYWQGDEFPYYSASNGLKGTFPGAHDGGFYYYDHGWKRIEQSSIASAENKVEITTLTNSNYVYYPETLTEHSDPLGQVGLSRDSVEYQLLFGSDGSYPWYGLANESWKGAFSSDGSPSYGYFGVFNGLVGNLACARCSGKEKADPSGVRPVVSLESDVILKPGDGEWKIDE